MTAVREAIEGTLTGTRAVPVSAFRFGGQNVDDETLLNRARDAYLGGNDSTLYDVRISPQRKSGIVEPSHRADPVLLATVTVWLTLPLLTKDLPESVPDVRVRAANDHTLIAESLEYPGRLSTTDAGDETGLVSGSIDREGDPVVEREDLTAQLYQTSQAYLARIQTARA